MLWSEIKTKRIAKQVIKELELTNLFEFSVAQVKQITFSKRVN